jgi:peptidoglycan hydrolase-like protein with peptidoglycan-binding domain
MAHQLTREQIDQAAAQEAATIKQELASQPPAPPADTTLAYGASGECVTKLVDLLALLGYDTNDVIKGTATTLDESVLVDVRAAQAALNVTEPELTEAAQIPVGVKGELVGEATWNALYAAAEAKLQAEQTAAEQAAASAQQGAASAS